MPKMRYKVVLLFLSVALYLPAGSRGSSVCTNPQPVGLADGRIADSRLKAKQWSPCCPARAARLHSGGTNLFRGGWVTNAGTKWLQVDLGKIMKVTHLATQGRNYAILKFVKSYKVSHSRDGEEFTTISQVFSGNTDTTTVVSQELSPAVAARVIKIHPQSWHGSPGLRLEVYGCPVERDCLDHLHAGHMADGEYTIFPNGRDPLTVHCDQSTNGGGFVVFQRRLNGASGDFNKNWNDYKVGFSHSLQESWLGNENLHTITKQPQQLLIEMVDFADEAAHASYGRFQVESEADKFLLQVEDYSGTAGDSLIDHQNRQFFSTSDQDNDEVVPSCAADYAGGWWYGSCPESNLNGPMGVGGSQLDKPGRGVVWESFKGLGVSLKQTEMKMRPRKERDLDYDLNFLGSSAPGRVRLPRVTGFKEFTVSWWMKAIVRQEWTTILSLFSTSVSLAFSYRANGGYRLVVDNSPSDFTVPEWPIANDYWHHVCITWTSTNGRWVFYVDGLQRQSGTTKQGVTLPGGPLVLGQLHSALDSFDASSSFTGLLSRFNVWDRNLTEASDVERISQACCAEIGNVVPWPEVYLRLEGHFVKQTSSLCAYPETHRWDFSDETSDGKFRDALSGRTGVITVDSGTPRKGSFALTGTSSGSIDVSGSCLADASLCEHGLSVSFWLRHTRHSEGTCPVNWHYFRGSCYNVSSHASEMDAARRSCAEHGADLVKIESDEELTFIGTIAASGFYYIGRVQNQASPKVFTWMDGSAMDNFKWSVVGPDDTPNPFCTGYSPSGPTFKEIECNMSIGFICEKDDARHILSTRGTASTGPGFSLYYNGHGRSYELSLSATPGHVWHATLADDTLLESQWIHVMFTWSEPNGLGLHVGAAVKADVIPKTYHGTTSVYSNQRRTRPYPYAVNSSSQLVIGKDRSPDARPAESVVEISDLRIWEMAVSSARIPDLYKTSVQANDWFLWKEDRTNARQWRIGEGCKEESEKGACDNSPLPVAAENLTRSLNLTLVEYSSVDGQHSHTWRADIGRTVVITEVETHFDESAASSGPKKLQVRIGNDQNGTSDAGPVCGTTVMATSETHRRVRCATPLLGHYVTVQLSGFSKMNLAGVAVHRAVTSKQLPTRDPGSAFKLVFPRKNTADYVIIKRTLKLSDLSVCYWIKPPAIVSGGPHIFTITTTGNDFVSIIHKTGIIAVVLGATDFTSSFPVTTSQWHHTCVTLNGQAAALYIDGSLTATFPQDAAFAISHEATFVLGQDQDFPGGGFETHQAFHGELFEFNMWDYALDWPAVIKMAASMCADEPVVGNVIGWPELAHYMKGQVRVEPLGCQLEADVLKAPECSTYTILSEPDRAESYSNRNTPDPTCDKDLNSGWYRFSGLAGTQMAESCVPERNCGTESPGWLLGGHPTTDEGNVNRTVCFHEGDDCCKEQRLVQVRNCGGFFVYKLEKTQFCRARYCGAKPANENGYKLIFPRKSEEDFAAVEQNSTFSALTLCAWVRFTSGSTEQSIFSFAKDSPFRQVQLLYSQGDRKLEFRAHNKKVEATLTNPLDNGYWHHVCVTWDIQNGPAQIWLNASQKANDALTGFQPIDDTVFFVLGVEQGRFSGGFKQETAFSGEVALLNLWGYVLDRHAIARMFKFCEHHTGTVLAWSQFRGHTRGRVGVTAESCPAAPGETLSYAFSEASFPAVKGAVSRLVGPYVVEALNCLTFRYHMLGEDVGRLNVFVLNDHDFYQQTAVWRLAGSKLQGWKTGMVPIKAEYPYKVIFETITGSGHRGDISVEGITLGINEECKFHPEKAQLRTSGIMSDVIGHIPSYRAQLMEWVESHGYGNKRWVPCYRALEHGYSVRTFWEKCSGKRPSITIIRQKSYVFGGFTDRDWKESSQALPSNESFLFSLHSATYPDTPTKFDLLPNGRDSAISWSLDKAPIFGSNDRPDLSANLDKKTVFVNLTNSYNASNYDHDEGLVGNPWSSFDDLELLVVGDSLCDPPCERGATCDEILGRCVCDPTQRDEELCNLGLESRGERQALCAATEEFPCYKDQFLYPLYDTNREGQPNHWRCYAESALTSDHASYDPAKKSTCYFTQHHILLSVSKDMLAVNFHALLKESLYFMPLDGDGEIMNIQGKIWATQNTYVILEKGLRAKAIEMNSTTMGYLRFVYPIDDVIKNPRQAPDGMAIALWLNYEPANNSVERTFLISGKANKQSVRFYQPALRHTEKAVLVIQGASASCTCTFDAPSRVWTHYVFTWNKLALCDDVWIYMDGALASVSRVGALNSFSSGAGGLDIGVNQEPLTGARFDDILVWKRYITKDEVETLYRYYAGAPNLKAFISMELPGLAWSEELNDPESHDHQNVVKNITDTITKLYVGKTVRIYGLLFSRSSVVNVNFTAAFNESSYAALRNLEEFLRGGDSHFKLVSFEANDIALRFTFTATPVNWTTVQLNFTAPDNMQTGIYHHFNLTIRRRNQSAVRSVPVSAGSLVHLLPGFVGLNNYTLTGVPWTLEGPGKEFQVSVAMPEGVPDAPPSYVTVINIRKRSIDIRLGPVPTDNQHGVILGYHVVYNSSSGEIRNTTVPGNQSEALVTGLMPFTVYDISVAAFTRLGVGPFTTINVTTAQQAPLAAPPNVTVSLHVINGSRTSNVSVDVTWSPIPREYHAGILKGYRIFVQAVNGTNRTAWVRLCKLVTRCEGVATPEPFRLYNITVAGYNEGGNGPRAQVYFVTPEDVPSSPPQNISALNGSNAEYVNVSWAFVPRLELNGILRGYRVTLGRMDSPQDKRTFMLCPSVHQVQVWNVTAYASYGYCVQALTVGWSECVLQKFQSFESVPTAAPDVLRGYNTSSTSLKVEFLPVANTSVPGILRGYVVKLAHETSVRYAVRSSCANRSRLGLEMTDLEKYTSYAISVAAFTSRGEGPFSSNLTVYTDEDVPDAAPVNISVPATTPDGVTLSWGSDDWDGKNGRILGYRLILFDTRRNKTKNMTVYASYANLSALFPYTSYEVRVVPFTSKGEGNVSTVIAVKTEEAAPSKPPEKVDGENASSTGIKLNWKPVDELFVNGKVRSYVIYYYETNSAEKTVYNISVPVENSRRRRRAVPDSSPSFVIQGLKKYTTYTVQIAANTVDVGVRSPLMNITTSEDVPTRPPVNISAYNTSSTSVRVEWQPVPSEHLNGILRAYVVLHRRADRPDDNFAVTSVGPAVQTADLLNLGKYKMYDVRVLAVTVGDGIASGPVLVRTDQDIPDSPPVNFTSSPLNTTAIEMKWLHVPLEEQNGIILGYNVQLYDVAANNIRNTTLDGANTTSVVLAGLEIWTNYSYRVSAFTVKGEGPWSAVAKSRTAEEAPRFPPSNVTAHNTSSTSLHVTWQPVNRSAIRGILRGYRVFYTSQDQRVFPEMSGNVSVGADTLEADLLALYKYTNYSVTVAAFTIADGKLSEAVYVKTAEDIPDRPPSHVTLARPSSTSFAVNWDEVPLGYRNGIIRSYSVQIEPQDQSEAAAATTVDADTLTVTLTGLRKFFFYNITIWANTSIGGGARYQVPQMTDEDVPNIPPPNVTAENHVTTHTIPVRWKGIPFLETNGILLGYRLEFRIVNMGEYPYFDENLRSEYVGPGVTSLVLTNLASFAVYEILATAVTVKGDGPPAIIHAETCRCVKRLTTNWREYRPYVEKNASGLLPPIFNDMAVECCRSCKTHGKTWVDFDWDGDGMAALKPGKEEVHGSIGHQTDFHFPVYGYKMQNSYQQEFGYIGLIESSGIAHIVNTDPGEKIARSVLWAVFDTWPLIMLCLLFAYVAGICLWITERWFDSTKFPKSFIGGAGEGLWWAYVTMTTVGYGDRTAVSIPGRVVGIAWTLIGLVINGILVSALATALTSVSSNVSDYPLYGSTVAAIPGSAEYHLSVRKNAYLDTAHSYENYADIQKLLVNRDIDGALIDAFAIGSEKHLFERPFLRINRIYDYGSTYGVVMGGDSRKLQRCFDNWIPMNIAKIFKHIENNVEQIEEPDEPLAAEVSSQLFDSSSHLFRNTLMFCSALLGVGLILGVGYEFFYHRKHLARVASGETNVRKENLGELRAVLEDFYESFNVALATMREDHRSALQCLMRKKGRQRKHWYLFHGPKTSRVGDMDMGLEPVQEGSEALCIRNEGFLEPDSGREGESKTRTDETEA